MDITNAVNISLNNGTPVLLSSNIIIIQGSLTCKYKFLNATNTIGII
jgi:hypothetical protein